jgi:hypothetical protein
MSESNPTEFRVEWNKLMNYSWSYEYFMNNINFVKKRVDWRMTEELPSVKVLVAEEPMSSIYTRTSAVFYGYESDIINHSRRREHVEKHHIGAGNKVKLNFRRREKMNSGDASKSENKAKPA